MSNSIWKDRPNVAYGKKKAFPFINSVKVIDRWGHWQNLGLEAFFVGVSKHAEEK